ncbi:tetratricopeptide repeat protein [Flavitalea sp. BT771]|uniref:tetratricopeptide repeat protein n=1 Tax=Flavitalea sp. BT771 TaxID=3063329 RepID=UPI0026E47614|nr:tetratricopeptide repeat protein [Flavitalea sp. BT771]MDO6433766.1 tetratricopeptide repeat protein [Flavitalea sp. BT771]MDV6222329.1 tetratricopeptide repeat protein [Flavitalea sp. BT771]
MKRQQIMVVGTGVLLLLALYFFGQTVPPQKKQEPSEGGAQGASISRPISTEDILQASQSKLTPTQLEYVTRLQHAVVRGDVKVQQLDASRSLAAFWRDSVQNGFLPFAYYTAEVAKLENSEKSLTFAARIFLESLRGQDNPAIKSWMATNAKELFEKALELNPQNDSTKVGLGASYVFGSTAGSPTEVMQGIQRILEVARRDTSNMYAQFMLGWGGIVSGQFDKAIERLTTVVRHQPANIEAILLLAEVHQQQGNKADAIRWYQVARKLVGNPDMIKEIDQSIQSLR